MTRAQLSSVLHMLEAHVARLGVPKTDPDFLDLELLIVLRRETLDAQEVVEILDACAH